MLYNVKGKPHSDTSINETGVTSMKASFITVEKRSKWLSGSYFIRLQLLAGNYAAFD
jgi:hypothetical protein